MQSQCIHILKRAEQRHLLTKVTFPNLLEVSGKGTGMVVSPLFCGAVVGLQVSSPIKRRPHDQSMEIEAVGPGSAIY